MKAIGIDLGTTGICGILMDAECGEICHSITKPSDSFIKTENEWERVQDVRKIEKTAFEILDSLINTAGDEVVSIGISGQMHGIVYINKSGEAVSNLYTWQDGRGNLPYENGTYASYLGSSSGYGSVTDFYNRVNKLRPSDASSYCTIADYFVLSLCGLKSPIMHPTNAASLGGYDLTAKKFKPETGIEVRDGFTTAGCYRGIPVAIAIGDNQASVFSALKNDQSALINVGTGAQVSVISDEPILAEGIECRPYFDEKYLIAGSALCGGRAYALLFDFYKKLLAAAGVECDDLYPIMNALAEAGQESTLIFDTRFSGTRAHPEIRGSVTNIGTGNFTPEGFTAALVRGMVTELHNMYLASGVNAKEIVGSGNGIRKNPALIKAAEQTFGAKMHFPVYFEEAACGAALFSLVSAGIYPDTSSVRRLIKYEE